MNLVDLIASGRFVIVAEMPIYCHITDALIGVNSRVVSDHATRNEAESVCPLGHEDLCYIILPQKPEPPMVRVIEHDEMWF